MTNDRKEIVRVLKGASQRRSFRSKIQCSIKTVIAHWKRHSRRIASAVPRRNHSCEMADDDLPALLARAHPDPLPPERRALLAAFVAAAAPNSLRALASDGRILSHYQDRWRQPLLPVTSFDLAEIIADRSRQGRAKASIDRLVSSIVKFHDLLGYPSPIDQTVRYALRAMRKADARPVRQARGLRLKGDVETLTDDAPNGLSLLTLLATIPDDLAGLRDKALLSCGYDAGLRRSELVAMRFDQLTRLARGEGALHIPHSKTDQEGEGATAWLSSRSMDLLSKWTEAAGITEGYIFRSLSPRKSASGHLDPASISRIIKARVAAGIKARSGVEDGALVDRVVQSFSGHSLRVGCDQDLVAAGVGLPAIMQALRWKSPRQPLAYARHLAAATSPAAAAIRSLEKSA